MKHKHAEVIQEYINGKECECWSKSINDWHPISSLSAFDFCEKVRIKPEPKPDIELFSKVYNHENGIAYITHAITIKEFKFNLKLIFDGETNELKSSEVIK